VSGKLNAYANELAYSKLKNQVLEEKLRLQRIAKYGPGSEKLNSLQLELLEQERGVSNTEVTAESERDALPSAPEKKKRKHPGRQTLPADPAAGRAGNRVHSGTVHMRQLRWRNQGDRLRSQ